MITKLPFNGNFRVTCEYGRKGTLWGSGVHGGIDLVGDTDKNVYSICNGTVVYAGWENANNTKQGFGKYVKIQEEGTNRYIYLAHLDKIYVSKGAKVTPLTIVGYMGSTGNSTGAHTHVEIRENNVKQNPANYMGIPNVVGSYKASDYAIDNTTETTGELRTIASNTNLRSEPHTLASKTLYVTNTTLYVLEPCVAVADGYTWDKVKIRVSGKEGYMINSNYKEGPVAELLRRSTNLRNEPTTSSSEVTLYQEDTLVKILQSNAATADGYTWDKVKVVADGKEGYMINKNYK